MAKRKGGSKIRQKGFVVDHEKKHGSKGPKAPWADPLQELVRGGHRH